MVLGTNQNDVQLNKVFLDLCNAEKIHYVLTKETHSPKGSCWFQDTLYRRIRKKVEWLCIHSTVHKYFYFSACNIINVRRSSQRQINTFKLLRLKANFQGEKLLFWYKELFYSNLVLCNTDLSEKEKQLSCSNDDINPFYD